MNKEFQSKFNKHNPEKKEKERAYGSVWFKGLSDDDADNLEAALANSKIVLGRLKELVGNKLETLNSQEDFKDYDTCPNWALKRADFIGQRRTLKFVLNQLLTAK